MKEKICGATPEQVAKWAKAHSEGRLVVMPCRVGDTAYFIRNTRGCANCTRLDGSCNGSYCPPPRVIEAKFYYKHLHEADDVFATRAEAEAALAERTKPMTNFEHLRKNLTIASYAHLMDKQGDCDLCPAKESCIDNVDCDKSFLAWANTEYIDTPKPCPFCGKEKARLIINYDRRCRLVCGGCHASTDLHKTAEQALDAWNRRVV